MTTLRLVGDPAGQGNGASAGRTVVRLPRGRHGLPADLVRAHQRQRLYEAAAAALAEQGYARIAVTRVIELARVSSATFYQHFDDMWACLGAAYETETALLCRSVEGACGAAGEDRGSRATSGIAAALDFLAAEPHVARLLSAEPPPQADRLVSARLALVERLGTLLRSVRVADEAPPAQPVLERRMVSAALAMVSTRVVAGEAESLLELEPQLSEFLLSPL